MSDWLTRAAPIAEADARDAGAAQVALAAANGRPLVLRGLTAHWPLVAAARQGIAALAERLAGYGQGAPMNVFTAPPGTRGHYFYRDDMAGFNFRTERATMPELLDRLLWASEQADPPSFYAGSTPAADFMPGFLANHMLPVDAPGAIPRLWTGNASHIATHFDQSDNIAVIVSGVRRFVLFPPDQVANLYLGPLNKTPAGQPVSMVAVDDPDLARYPRFAGAMATAQVATLDPGDAIFIPSLWWHNIRATGPLNLMVNYWCDAGARSSPLLAFAHSLLAIRDLPAAERAAWRTWFDHFIFGDNAATAADHLPPQAQGVQGAASPERDETIRNFVLRGLMGPR
ncbi:cupin-like domain-containing protein [Sphingopyxis sp.]|uniref:cupin-like domain-containing protein n=1 Tax=Sphingopyxis sp. TaxID=1908224 RepID=UPI002B46907F|nr:cupin-like domain-containing protein [Sphingopyxis sp.]HJS12667.1 cupin-like domain-containing protein [Sphingopyxis sp.]